MQDQEFFDDNEVQDIAQSHIERIVKLENNEAERIIKLYKRIRQDLRDRLDTLPDGTFSETRLRGVLAQIDSAIEASSGILNVEMDTSAQMAAERSVEDTIKELESWNKAFKGSVIPINVDALAVATNTKNFLFNRYQTSMQTYNSMLRARFAQGLTNSVVEQISMSEVVSRIAKTFMGEEWKINQIVRTELHNVYGLGKLNSMYDLWDNGQGDIPDLMKGLFHPMDNRTGQDSVYADRLNLIAPLDEPFEYVWKGEKRKFMAPPDRPNDRSILIPYRSSWK